MIPPRAPLRHITSATRAFNSLEGEMALMRLAVKRLATERAEIDIPNYSSTLTEMAERLVAIDDKPAMQMTPEGTWRGRSQRQRQQRGAKTGQLSPRPSSGMARLHRYCAASSEPRR